MCEIFPMCYFLYPSSKTCWVIFHTNFRLCTYLHIARSKASNCLLQTNPQSVSSIMVPSKLPGMVYTANEQCQILFGPLASFCQEMQVRSCPGGVCEVHIHVHCISLRRGRGLYFKVGGSKSPQSWKEGFSKKFFAFPPELLEVIYVSCGHLINKG